MALQALLVLALIMSVLFVWRASNRSKGLSGLAAALAVGAGILLLKSPIVAVMAIAAAALLIGHLTSKKP